ncbi:MAG: Na-translocating system protein MpsC family protein, partial [Bacillota bacterium]|nr:Na-translocating system protein MpsC family protein [Bacillota bacterium]
MQAETLEMQEKIRKLAVKIIKHYRGKGPDNVKVKVENELITIHIKGILSNLSEILVKEGAAEKVVDYWSVMKPYLEKEFLDEAVEVIGCKFDYSWEICDFEKENRTITILIKKLVT